MADEMYDADGDVSRFLQSPEPEDHLLLPVSDLGAAAHVGAMQDAVPAVTHVQAQPAAAFGLQAPATNVQHHQAPAFVFQAPAIGVQQQHVPTYMDVQPPSINVEHHQAPAFVFQAPAIGDEQHQGPTYMDVQQQGVNVVVDHHQAPAFGFQQPPTIRVGQHPAPTLAVPAPSLNVEHQQAPVAMDVQITQEMPAPVQAYGNPDATLDYQGADDELPAWYVDLLANGVTPPGSPSLHQQFLIDTEDEMEDGNADDGAMADELEVNPVEEQALFVPYVHGDQLDCTRCSIVREVLHHSEKHKTHFIVHAAEPGVFQHAIIDRLYIGPDGMQTADLHYIDLRGRTHEWVYNFIAASVETMQNDPSGQVQDTLASFYDAFCTNISVPPANDDAPMDLEVDGASTSGTSLPMQAEAPAPETSLLVSQVVPSVDDASAPKTSLPVMQGEASASEAALPVTQAEENTNKRDTTPKASLPVTQAEANTTSGALISAVDLLGFQPVILESSHVRQQALEESGRNALLYPSLLERLGRIVSELSMDEADEYFKKTREETAREPNLSSPAFKLLARKDKTYRMQMRRINDINKKMMKLEETAPRCSTSGLFLIKQKMELFKQEKAVLFAKLNEGLQENVKANGGAGPSGSS
ncbi:hypothetical protein ACP70R_034688 [Stipagrostis hirtigluma subsp. patula]